MVTCQYKLVISLALGMRQSKGPVGDSLGAAVEFKPPGTFEPMDGYRAGGPHGLEPGEWTDDTSISLALADSMIHAGWDLEDQAKRYLTWWKQGKYSVNGQVSVTYTNWTEEEKNENNSLCVIFGCTAMSCLRRDSTAG